VGDLVIPLVLAIGALFLSEAARHALAHPERLASPWSLAQLEWGARIFDFSALTLAFAAGWCAI
jgi:hypothetical protein